MQTIESQTDAKILRIEAFDWLTKVKLFQNCKILLNIHADETFQVFESARCIPFLDAGIPVWTETAYDIDTRCNKKFDAHNVLSQVRQFLADA